MNNELKKSIKHMSLREIEEKQLAIFEDYIASLTIKTSII